MRLLVVGSCKPVPGSASATGWPVVLAGNLAVWVAAAEGRGAAIEWDAQAMKVKNVQGLEPLITPEYRQGYTLTTY